MLWQMRCLFLLYGKGEALSTACGDHLRRIGLALLATPIAAVVYGMCASVLLSWPGLFIKLLDMFGGHGSSF